MTQLQQFWLRWLTQYSNMCRSEKIDPEKLAAPFFSAVPRQPKSPLILYVGKATAGCWHKESFLKWMKRTPQERVSERLGCTRQWLETVRRGEYRSQFWDFGIELNAIAAATTKLRRLGFQNLVWSNVAKIGRIDANPRGTYFELQRALAVQTLKTEITIYRPSLIYFASWDICDEYVIGELLDDPQVESWPRNQRLNDDGIWCRPGQSGSPPVVWTQHPQGKSRAQRNLWLRKVAKVLGSAGVPARDSMSAAQ